MLPGILATLGTAHLRALRHWPAAAPSASGSSGSGGWQAGGGAVAAAAARAAVQLLSAPFAPQAGLLEADTGPYMVWCPVPPRPAAR